MKLLITTQAVDKNNPALGFFLDWIREFAKHCERVTVICLYKGEYDLPSNVKVLSLGKEDLFPCQRDRLRGGGRFGTNFQFPISNIQLLFSKIKYIFLFYRYIISERRNYNAVFVHMNQIYAILGDLFWRMSGRKIGLWYAHGKVSLSLKLAEKLTDVIFTASQESCRLSSKKINIVGHGIDLSKFEYKERKRGDIFKIITVGRISPSKDLKTIIEAFALVEKNNKDVSLKIVGGIGVESDKKYLEEIKNLIKEKGLGKKIIFAGPVPAETIAEYLYNADLFVSASRTGSLDKVLLEAMATGLPVISSNEAFKGLVSPPLEGDLGGSFAGSGFIESLIFLEGDPQELAGKIANLIKPSNIQINKRLSDLVREGYGLDKLILKICYNLDGETSR